MLCMLVCYSVFQYKGLQGTFPENIHLLTLEYLETNKMLLRLENQFEADEPVVNNLNSKATINLSVRVVCSTKFAKCKYAKAFLYKFFWILKLCNLLMNVWVL